MPVAPHQNAEVRLVLAGIKPLGTIEKRKDPIGYSIAISCGAAGMLKAVVVVSEDSPEGEVVIVKNGNAELIVQYTLLLARGVQDYGIKEYHRKMGRLFGYAEQDIEDFINTEVNCECSKCTGSTTLH
jgi:hypothetical protein